MNFIQISANVQTLAAHIAHFTLLRLNRSFTRKFNFLLQVGFQLCLDDRKRRNAQINIEPFGEGVVADEYFATERRTADASIQTSM
jgi:hypothetical protein